MSRRQILLRLTIASLYLLYTYQPRLFQMFHVTFWQAIIIILAWVYFFFWIERFGSLEAPGIRAAPADGGYDAE